ncbi:hypothetical protein F4804DRAFT_191688 [Jackrogersella minutella]|nr:hypothetical protein F4804DRAFT_191688 [Jackrogersella minutella]
MSSVAISPSPEEELCLESLPAEILLQIMEEMTPSALSDFALSCKRFFNIFIGHKDPLMATVLKGLPEFNTMLYLFTADKDELHPDRMLHPRVIDFNTGSDIINFMQPDAASNLAEVPQIMLDPGDVVELWNLVTIVDWWVELYPRLRWRELPLDRRCLRAKEEVRLRKAIARWWLFAHFHHGFSYYYRSFQQPNKWSTDTRLQHIRSMSTGEICELGDLWEVLKDTVSKDLCSSPERVCLCQSPDGVDLVPWGADDGHRHQTIVNTYMKLAPDQLKYFLTVYTGWQKGMAAKAISKCTRDFRRDTETLSVSINKVLQERMTVKELPTTSSIPRFGIVDEDRASDQDIAEWVDDAWLDGKVPLTESQIVVLPRDASLIVTRGDDGTDDAYPS